MWTSSKTPSKQMTSKVRKHNMLLSVPRGTGSSIEDDWRVSALAWAEAGRTVKSLSTKLTLLERRADFRNSYMTDTNSCPAEPITKELASKISEITSGLYPITPVISGLVKFRNDIASEINEGAILKEVGVPVRFRVQNGAEPSTDRAGIWTRGWRAVSRSATGEGSTKDDLRLWKRGDTVVTTLTGTLIQNLEASQSTWGSTIASGLWQAATLPLTTMSTMRNVAQSFGARHAESKWAWMGDHELDNSGSWYDQIWTRLQGKVPSEWNWAEQTEISVSDLERLSTFASRFIPAQSSVA